MCQAGDDGGSEGSGSRVDRLRSQYRNSTDLAMDDMQRVVREREVTNLERRVAGKATY